MIDDGVDEGHRLGTEVVPPDGPFVVLLGEEHPDEPEKAAPIGKVPTNVGPSADLLVEPLPGGWSNGFSDGGTAGR